MDSLKAIKWHKFENQLLYQFFYIIAISWLKKKTIKNSKFQPFQTFATLKCLIQPWRWYKMLIL